MFSCLSVGADLVLARIMGVDVVSRREFSENVFGNIRYERFVETTTAQVSTTELHSKLGAGTSLSYRFIQILGPQRLRDTSDFGTYGRFDEITTGRLMSTPLFQIWRHRFQMQATNLNKC